MPLLSELSRLFRNFANGWGRERFLCLKYCIVETGIEMLMSANRVTQDMPSFPSPKRMKKRFYELWS